MRLDFRARKCEIRERRCNVKMKKKHSNEGYDAEFIMRGNHWPIDWCQMAGLYKEGYVPCI